MGSDRVMLALYDFYPSKADLLGEAMAGWTIVATFLLLITLLLGAEPRRLSGAGEGWAA